MNAVTIFKFIIVEIAVGALIIAGLEGYMRFKARHSTAEEPLDANDSASLPSFLHPGDADPEIEPKNKDIIIRQMWRGDKCDMDGCDEYPAHGGAVDYCTRHGGGS